MLIYLDTFHVFCKKATYDELDAMEETNTLLFCKENFHFKATQNRLDVGISGG